jgi:hypothetical protein
MIADPKDSETFIVFPIEDAHVFPVVTHTLDFKTGKVDVAGAQDQSLSGRLEQDRTLRSVIFYMSHLINVEILLNDDLQFKGPIPPGLFEIRHMNFNLIRVELPNAQISGAIYASTHPEAFGGNAL